MATYRLSNYPIQTARESRREEYLNRSILAHFFAPSPFGSRRKRELKRLLSAPIQEKEKYVLRQGLIRLSALLAAGAGLYLFRASGGVIMAVVLFSILYVVHVADRFSVKKLERAKGLAAL